MELYLNLGKPKTFGDLIINDPVYLIDPNTGMIVESKIRHTMILKPGLRNAILKMQIYKLTEFENITHEKMEEANKEYQTKVWWDIRVMKNTTLGLVTLQGVGIPTAISADKKHLEKWIAHSSPLKNRF